MKKTLETVVRETLAHFPAETRFRVVAYELTHDGDCWSVNTPFTLAREADLEEVLSIARARWEVFKLNYSPRARVSYIQDISDDETAVELEVDFMAFLRVEALEIETPPAPLMETPDRDTADFLESVLWAYPEDDDGENPMSGKTVCDFSPEFIAAASGFISGFREYLTSLEIEIPDSPRSFGGNVYFSLSGHGCGFWDSFETEHLQGPLEAFSGSKYRFEEIMLSEDESGKLDLSILPEFIAEARARMFTPAYKA